METRITVGRGGLNDTTRQVLIHCLHWSRHSNWYFLYYCSFALPSRFLIQGMVSVYILTFWLRFRKGEPIYLCYTDRFWQYSHPAIRTENTGRIWHQMEVRERKKRGKKKSYESGLSGVNWNGEVHVTTDVWCIICTYSIHIHHKQLPSIKIDRILIYLRKSKID